MRVIELCLSDALGGLELSAIDFAHWLHQHGHFCLAVVRPGSRLQAHAQAIGTPRQTLNVSFRQMPWLAARQLAALVRQHRIEILHVHWKNDLILGVLCKRLVPHLQLVHTRHMSMPHSKKDIYHRWLYRHVDTYIANCHWVAAQARRNLALDTERIHSIYLGTTPAAAASDCDKLMAEWNWPRHLFRIAVFGRIKAFKGQHVMLGALKILRNHGMDMRLLIMGHAMDKEYLTRLRKQVVRDGLDQQVRFEDFHPNPRSIMPCFDLIAMTSREETFGLVLVEAMRAGTAVIGSNAGGAREIFEHGKSGLFFAPDSEEDLATQIETLMADPLKRKRLAATGKRRADSLFDRDTQYEKVLTLLSDPVPPTKLSSP